MHIPFNKPFLTGRELDYIRQAHANGQLSGNGPFTQKCQAWIQQHTGSSKGLLTHSCTGALEMAAILLDLKPGDEVIMPSYTFVSTANAFVLRGAVPVFVDIRPDTLNLDEAQIEEAITPRTRAIVAVHYAGVACEMEAIAAIASKHGLFVVEDAAQGIGAAYQGKPLGQFGCLAALSFHETKNIISGEGGALLVNDGRFLERAEIIREKGTDRSKFMRGQVDKYTWVDIGSSYLPSELIAAFLWAQMEKADAINAERMRLWEAYHEFLRPFEEKGLLRRPIVPGHARHNAHLYYILFPDKARRDHFLTRSNQEGINTVFHYVPLHDSLGGLRYGRAHGGMDVTLSSSQRLVRLPLWMGLKPHLPLVFEKIAKVLSEL